MTPCRPWQLQNRSLHARVSTKKTLYHGYFPGTKNARNGTARHLQHFSHLVKSGTLPHQAAWLVHKRLLGSRTNGSVMRGFPIRYLLSRTTSL